MNEEENFQQHDSPVEETSQEKGGNKMRKLIYGLLIVAVIAVVAACAPSLVNDVPAPDGDVAWETSVDIHGMEVEYRFVNTPLSSGAMEFNYQPVWSGSRCEISVYEENKDLVTAENLSYSVGFCFAHVIYGEGDFGDDEWFENVDSFILAYTEEYKSSCGDNREPLINASEFDACKVPAPEDITI